VEWFKDIERFQGGSGANLLLRTKPFQLLVREIAQDFKSDLRFQSVAVELFQKATEAFVVSRFERK